MARYIDLEELERRIKEHIKAETPEEKALIEWCKDECIRQAYAMPTANVVPKSEEGAECPTCHGTGRIGTTNWLTKNMTKKQIAEEKAKAIAEHEKHIKADVAREIFEEIEKITSLIIAGQKHYIVCERELTELKKKYTEGEVNR